MKRGAPGIPGAFFYVNTDNFSRGGNQEKCHFFKENVRMFRRIRMAWQLKKAE